MTATHNEDREHFTFIANNAPYKIINAFNKRQQHAPIVPNLFLYGTIIDNSCFRKPTLQWGQTTVAAASEMEHQKLGIVFSFTACQ